MVNKRSMNIETENIPIAMQRMKVSMAPLEPEYTGKVSANPKSKESRYSQVCLGTPLAWPVMEPIMMSLPPIDRCRYASRATKNCPRVLMFMTRSYSSSVTSPMWPKETTPEFEQTMLSSPKWALACANKEMMSLTTDTLALTAIASLPHPFISATTSFAASSLLA